MLCPVLLRTSGGPITRESPHIRLHRSARIAQTHKTPLIVPGPYYDKPDTGIVSVMIEINKRLFRSENPSGSGNVNKNIEEKLDTADILCKI